MLYHLAKIGNNLNQITKHLNSTRVVDSVVISSIIEIQRRVEKTMTVHIESGSSGWGNYVLYGTKDKPRDSDKVELIEGDIGLGDRLCESNNYERAITRWFYHSIKKSKKKQL